MFSSSVRTSATPGSSPPKTPLASEVTGSRGVVDGRLEFLNREQAYDEKFRARFGSTIEQIEREIRRLKK
jgi:hypothetical protein